MVEKKGTREGREGGLKQQKSCGGKGANPPHPPQISAPPPSPLGDGGEALEEDGEEAAWPQSGISPSFFGDEGFVG